MTRWADLPERGSALCLQVTEACYRLLGERAARILLAPVVAYFLLTGGEARRASRQYFDRLNAFAGAQAALPQPGWRTSFRHMLAFAVSGLHKLAAWLGEIDPSRVDFPARAEFEELLASGRGALLVSAHLGNIEMMRALAVCGRVATINAVVYSNHARRFHASLARANPDFRVNLIEVSELGPDTGMFLSEKVEQGEIVVVVGDRVPPADQGRTCTVSFLGAPAPFPQGPFVLAAALKCPVYLFLCMEERGCYRVHFEKLADRVELPRGAREESLSAYLQCYARRLEEYCLRAPYQWFNFFDYWPDSARPAAGRRAQRHRPPAPPKRHA